MYLFIIKRLLNLLSHFSILTPNPVINKMDYISDNNNCYVYLNLHSDNIFANFNSLYLIYVCEE